MREKGITYLDMGSCRSLAVLVDMVLQRVFEAVGGMVLCIGAYACIGILW